MDQSSSLSDAISKNSSLLGGLLSQMSAVFADNSAQGSLFSSLLSQSDAMQTALATQAPTTPLSFVSAPTPTSAPSPSDGTASSSDALLQNLGDISSTLHKILGALRQNNSNSSSNNGGSSDGSTGSPEISSQTQASTPSTAPTAASPVASTDTSFGWHNHWTDNTASTSPASTTTTTPAVVSSSSDPTQTPTPSAQDPNQTLAEIIAELLMMTQMVILTVEQAQSAGNTTDGATQTADAIAATPSLDLSAGVAAGGAGATNDLGQGSGSASTPTDPLSQLLETLHQDIQQLLASGGVAASTSGSVASTPTTTDDADLVAQFAALDASIKQTFAALQGQVNGNAPSTPLALSPQANIGGALPAPSAVNSPATNAGNKTDDADPAQNQFFAAASIANASIQPSPNVSSAAPLTLTSSLGPVTADGKANDPTNTDAGSGFSAGGNASFSANALANQGSGLTADGLQAAGTYSFASTLSAFRAANGGSVGLPSVVDQVILQMNRGVKGGDDQISVQLHPSDLGKITVKLDVGSDGKVQGTVTADNPATLEMLQKDSRSLERALQDAGLRADPGSLQFSLNSGQNGNASQTADGQNTGDTVGNGTQTAGDTGDGSTPVALGALAETYYITPTGVNIYV